MSVPTRFTHSLVIDGECYRDVTVVSKVDRFTEALPRHRIEVHLRRCGKKAMGLIDKLKTCEPYAVEFEGYAWEKFAALRRKGKGKAYITDVNWYAPMGKKMVMDVVLEFTRSVRYEDTLL